MDKKDAIKISKSYLQKIHNSGISFSQAWLFGSFATGDHNENSDIDIAIVLDDNEKNTFDTEVKLMVIRKGEETIIEPHTFSKEDFKYWSPLVKQITDKGIKLK